MKSRPRNLKQTRASALMEVSPARGTSSQLERMRQQLKIAHRRRVAGTQFIAPANESIMGRNSKEVNRSVNYLQARASVRLMTKYDINDDILSRVGKNGKVIPISSTDKVQHAWLLKNKDNYNRAIK